MNSLVDMNSLSDAGALSMSRQTNESRLNSDCERELLAAADTLMKHIERRGVACIVSECHQALAYRFNIPASQIVLFPSREMAIVAARMIAIGANDSIRPLSPTDHITLAVLGYNQAHCDTSCDSAGYQSTSGRPPGFDPNTASLIYCEAPHRLTGEMPNYRDLNRLLETSDLARLIIDDTLSVYHREPVTNALQSHEHVIFVRDVAMAVQCDSIVLGCVIASETNAEQLREFAAASFSNAVSCAALLAVLHNDASIDDSLVRAKESCASLAVRLRHLHIEATDTQCGFTLIRVARPELVSQHMAAKGFAARDISKLYPTSGMVQLVVRSERVADDMVTALLSLPPEWTIGPDNTQSSGLRLTLRRGAETNGTIISRVED